MIRIVIFASGSGTNAENIVKYFDKNKDIEVKFIVANKNTAGVLDRAKRLDIPVKIITKKDLNSEFFLHFLESEAEFLILAGFLLKIPENIILKFSNKIINIHPALLPKYGGKGMYGMHIHKAVVANKETKTGISIHLVNENYDEGAILFQKEIDVFSNDSAEEVASKIHILEQENFPEIIERFITNNIIK